MKNKKKWILFFLFALPFLVSAQAQDTIPMIDLDLTPKHVSDEEVGEGDLISKPEVPDVWEDLGLVGPSYKENRKVPWWAFTPLAVIPPVIWLTNKDEPDEPVNPPTITCGQPVTLLWGEVLPPANPATVSVQSDCPDGFTTTHIGDVSNEGSGCLGDPLMITRTYEVVDQCGNTVQCEQTFTYLVDDEPPTLTCPENLLIEWGTEVPLPDASSLTVSDNCTPIGEIVVTHLSDIDNGGDGCVGNTLEIIRTYQATDACGNTSTCEQRISYVPDEEGPVISCPVDITVECDLQDDLSVTGQPLAEDNCTPQNEITLSYEDDESGLTDCNGTGILIRNWTATDLCGNASTCFQQITLEDLTAPVIFCPPNITVDCGQQDVLGITGEATATDNCDGNYIINYSDDLSGFSGCAGVIIRTWTAEDACGNVSTCLQEITVLEVDCPFGATFDITPADCGLTNGSITTTILPGGTYELLWSNGAVGTSVTDLAAGLYTVTISDLVGNCSEVYEVIVEETAPGYIEVLVVDPASCVNCGSIVVDLTGVGPFDVTVNGPVPITISDVPPGSLDLSAYGCLEPGSYSLEVFDLGIGTTCTDLVQVEVPFEQDFELIVVSANPPSFPGAFDGNIDLFIVNPGGIYPMIVLLNGAFYTEVFAPDFTIPNLGEGAYTVVVIDGQSGCESNPVFVDLISIPWALYWPIDHPNLTRFSFWQDWHEEVFDPSLAEGAIQELLVEHPKPEISPFFYEVYLPVSISIGGYLNDDWVLDVSMVEFQGMATGELEIPGSLNGQLQSNFHGRMIDIGIQRFIFPSTGKVRSYFGTGVSWNHLVTSDTRVFLDDEMFYLSDAVRDDRWEGYILGGLRYRPIEEVEVLLEVSSTPDRGGVGLRYRF